MLSASNVPWISSRRGSTFSNLDGDHVHDWGSHAPETCQLLRLNVGGASFCLLSNRIRRYPTSLLAQLVDLEHELLLTHTDGYISDTSEYFFDRSPLVFASIAQFLREDVLHVPESVCASTFLDELQFWQISTQYLAKCCEAKIPAYFEELRLEMEDPFHWQHPSAVRRYLYRLFNDPYYTGNTIYAVVALIFVFISVINLGVATVPKFQEAAMRNGFILVKLFLKSPFIKKSTLRTAAAGGGASSLNDSQSQSQTLIADGSIGSGFSVLTLNVSSQTVDVLEQQQQHEIELTQLEVTTAMIMHHISIVCIVFFTVEYLVRLWAAPARLGFILSPLNICDFVSTAPFYVEILIESLTTNFAGTGTGAGHSRLFNLIRVLRLLRILRILRIARYSIGMQSVALTLQRCYKSFLTLGVFVLVMVLIYSFFIIVVESDDPASSIDTLSEAFYWCIVTLTTVGYGDVVPITPAGKFASCVTAISGGLFLAFPVSIVVSTFLQTYREILEKAELRHRQRIVGTAKLGGGTLTKQQRKELNILLHDNETSDRTTTPENQTATASMSTTIGGASKRSMRETPMLIWNKLHSAAAKKTRGLLCC